MMMLECSTKGIFWAKSVSAILHKLKLILIPGLLNSAVPSIAGIVVLHGKKMKQKKKKKKGEKC